jgi:hypothetical protein
MSRGIRFVAVGLDHTTAGIELRERLSFAKEEIRPCCVGLPPGPIHCSSRR